MNNYIILFSVLASFLSIRGAEDQNTIRDGYLHGDPPYLLEEGWQPLLNGKNLKGWQYLEPEKGGWMAVSGVYWGGPDNPRKLMGVDKKGDRILNTVNGLERNDASSIITKQKYGDIELYLEFLMPDDGDSGIYFHGLYEIGIRDTWNKNPPREYHHCGAIVARWINEQYVGGKGPDKIAVRPAGEWQSLYIQFQAPRFNSNGEKTTNAKFVRVLLNGELIHENVEIDGPTHASMEIPEAEMNPLMLQGNYGPIAYRNIYVRPLKSDKN